MWHQHSTCSTYKHNRLFLKNPSYLANLIEIWKNTRKNLGNFTDQMPYFLMKNADWMIDVQFFEKANSLPTILSYLNIYNLGNNINRKEDLSTSSSVSKSKSQNSTAFCTGWTKQKKIWNFIWIIIGHFSMFQSHATAKF